MSGRALPLAAGVATSAATASARSDYLHRDRLSGRTQALMWPAYLLGAATIVVTAGAATTRRSRRSMVAGSLVGAVGCALLALGAGPFASLRQLAGTDTAGLITGGVYRFSRNPQYVGNILISAGAALGGRSLSGTAFTAAAAAAYAIYVPAEEAHLERSFGAEYARYRDRTHRWIGLPNKAARR